MVTFDNPYFTIFSRSSFEFMIFNVVVPKIILVIEKAYLITSMKHRKRSIIRMLGRSVVAPYCWESVDFLLNKNRFNGINPLQTI